MLRDFIRAGFGSVGAQIINIAALPMVARLYGPEEYAVWAIVVATAMIVGGIACLRYELAIVLPTDRLDGSALVLWCVLCTATIALAFAAVAFVLWLVEVLPAEAVPAHYIVFVPSLIATTGVTLALQHWAIRLGAYSLNSTAQIALAASTVSVQLLFGWLQGGVAVWLIAGSLVGQLVAVMVLVGGCAPADRRPILSTETVRRMLPLVRQHHRFPFYSLPYVLFGTVRERASIFIVALFLGARDAGLYAFAYRIMNFPVSLVSAALRPVIYRESSRSGVAALEARVNTVLRWLLITATPGVVLYAHFSERLFVLVFGDDWRDAASYADFFVVPMFTLMLCNWMDRILDVLGEQRLTMVMEIFFGTLSVVSLWAAFELELGLFAALAAQCAVLFAYNVAYLVAAFDRAGYSKRSFLAHVGTMASVAVVSELVVRLVV